MMKALGYFLVWTVVLAATIYFSTTTRHVSAQQGSAEQQLVQIERD